MVHQMTLSIFFTRGLSGKSFKNSIWYMDSRASNHMTYSIDDLKNIQKYNGTMNIQLANGNKLPIIATGYIGHPLKKYFLFTSFIF